MAIPKHRGKTILNSPRLQEFKKKKQQENKKRLLLLSFFTVVLFIGLVFLTRWERVNIKNIEVVGNKIIDTETIEEVVSHQLNGYYLWSIPKSNFLFYPKDSILKDLTKNLQRLQTVSLDIEGNTLIVSLTERHALFTWCGEIPFVVSEEEEKCYFLDDSGYVFDEAPFFSGDVYFRFYGNLTGNPESVLGSHYFKDIFSKLVAFEKFSEEISLGPVGMHIDQSGEIKMYLSPQNNGARPEVRLRTDMDFEKTAENLQTAITTDPLKTKFEKNYADLEYIDLRFGNKVYFKFND